MFTFVRAPIHLTRDETHILEECERESLIYHSVSLSGFIYIYIFFFFAIQYSMSEKSIISTHAKWFILGIDGFVSYCYGKTVICICLSKEISDSHLAKMIHGIEIERIFDIDINNYHERQNNDSNESIRNFSDVYLTLASY